MVNNKYLTTIEIAKILGISRIAVFKQIKKGQLKAEMLGGVYFIDKNELGGVFRKRLDKVEENMGTTVVNKTVKEYGPALEKLGKE